MTMLQLIRHSLGAQEAQDCSPANPTAYRDCWQIVKWAVEQPAGTGLKPGANAVALSSVDYAQGASLEESYQ